MQYNLIDYLKSAVFALRMSLMKKLTNNSVFKYTLIACLATALIFGQLFKLHMHVEHDDLHTSTSSSHSMALHTAFSFIDLEHITAQQDNSQENHPSEIKASPDSVVKKIESFTPYLLLFLSIFIFLGLPQLRVIFIQNIHSKLTSSYYLLNPPLRAPPIHTPV